MISDTIEPALSWFDKKFYDVLNNTDVVDADEGAQAIMAAEYGPNFSIFFFFWLI